MYFQTEQFRLAKTITVGGTTKIDLPDHGFLGSIFIVLNSTLTSTGLDNDYRTLPEEFVTKLEIIANGSHKIKTLDMKALQTLNWLDQGIFKPDKNFSYSTATQRSALLINFGRQLYDKEAGLDLSKFNSVELWITNSFTSAMVSGITADIFMIWVRDVAENPFKGHYQTEEFRSWTPVAGATEYIDLPSEGILRRFMLRAEAGVLAASGSYNKFYNIMREVKYSLKSGQLLVFDGRLMDLGWLNLFDAKSKPLTAYQLSNVDSAIYKRSALGYVFSRPFGVKAADSVVPTAPLGEIGGGDDTSFAITENATTWALMYSEYGVAPWSHIFFRHDHGGELGEGLDLEANKTVTIDALCRAGTTVTGANCRLILDRYFPD